MSWKRVGLILIASPVWGFEWCAAGIAKVALWAAEHLKLLAVWIESGGESSCWDTKGMRSSASGVSGD